MTVADFAKACGFSRDYWYKHADLSRPLTLGDLERISNVSGISAEDIVMNSRRHAIEESEYESRLTDELVDRITAQSMDFSMAANDDPNKMLEAETPRD